MSVELANIQEGDMLEFGVVFPTLTDEQIAWRVLENAEDPNDPSLRRITLHGYMFNAFVMAVIARVPVEGGEIEWRLPQ